MGVAAQYKTMNDPLGILKASKNVTDTAKYVTIREGGLDSLAEKIKEVLDGYKKWSSGLAEKITTGNLKDDVQFVFIENAVNFCFWPDKGQPKWEVNGRSGWNGLRACFERALAERVPILDANYLSSFSEKDGQYLFRGKGSEIPLLKERIQNLREAGLVLLEKYDGQFLNAVEESGFDAISLVKLITDNFPSFQDPFLKRAQITANDLMYILKDKKIDRLDELTAFADYKLPQVLRMFGIIQYNEELAEKIDNMADIPHDSREEIEIRAATVCSIELLRQRLGLTGQGNLPANIIDNIIWMLSQEITGETKPYHRTRTIYY